MKFIILPFMLTCQVSFGQYSLDVSAGYNHPFYVLNSTNIKEVHKSGEVFQIAVLRNFKRFYAHSFGVGYINRRINFLKKANSTSTTDIDYNKYNYSVGSIQFNFLGKLYPVENNGFAVNFGLTIEKQLFSNRKVNGVSQETSYQENLDYDVAFNLGLSYDWKINSNWLIYSQVSGAKSFYSLFESDFDENDGSSYGTIDYRAKIGLIYQLSDSIKTPKEIRTHNLLNNTRNQSIHAIELKSFFNGGNRQLSIPEDSADNAYPCGYCSTGYSLPKSIYTYLGVGIGLNYSYERFFSSLEISFERYNGNLQADYGVNYFHPYLPSGTIKDYYDEKDYYSFEMSRINYSLGLGVKILSPQRKFNIIPTLKFTQGRLLDFQINSSYYTKERYRYWDQTQDPAYNFSWDSVKSPSRFSEAAQKNSSILFGAIFTTTVYKKINLNVEMFFATKSSNIFSNSNVPFSDQLRYTFSIGISYFFPLPYLVAKTNVKPPL